MAVIERGHNEPLKHYRDVLVALFQDPHHRPTADSVLNELHQHGWKVVARQQQTLELGDDDPTQ
jgi:hypothetical protein